MINDAIGKPSAQRRSKMASAAVAVATLMALNEPTAALADGPPCGARGSCWPDDSEGKKALNTIYLSPSTTKEQKDRIDLEGTSAERGFATWDTVYDRYKRWDADRLKRIAAMDSSDPLKLRIFKAGQWTTDCDVYAYGPDQEYGKKQERYPFCVAQHAGGRLDIKFVPGLVGFFTYIQLTSPCPANNSITIDGMRGWSYDTPWYAKFRSAKTVGVESVIPWPTCRPTRHEDLAMEGFQESEAFAIAYIKDATAALGPRLRTANWYAVQWPTKFPQTAIPKISQKRTKRAAIERSNSLNS